MTKHKVDASEVAEWLPLFFAPDDLVEVRFIDVTRPGRVHVGWFPAKDAGLHSKKIATLANVSNLVNFCPHVLASSVASRGVPGQFSRVTRINGEKCPQPCLAGDVIARRWLIVDIDPVRPGDCAATWDEYNAGADVAHAIITDFGEAGLGRPIKVSSGNGQHLYYKLPELASGGGVGPDDQLAEALQWISAKYGSDTVKIDTGVYRSNQLMRLPGTWAKKGSDTTERPWRKCQVIPMNAASDYATNAEFFEALRHSTGGKVSAEMKFTEFKPRWMAGLSAEELRDADKVLAVGSGCSSAFERARAYLATIPGAISGQRGSAATYAAATALVHGFGLSVDDAVLLLASDYNPRCSPPWSGPELRHKCEDAAAKPHSRPKGWLLESSTSSCGSGSNPVAPPLADLREACGARVSTSSVGQVGEGIEGEADPIARDVLGNRPKRINEADNDPHRIGRYVLRFFQHQGRCTLAFWRGTFWEWCSSRSVWVEQQGHEFGPRVALIVREFAEKLHAKYEDQLGRGIIDEIPKSVAVTRVLLSNVMAALESMTLLRIDDSPAWLPGAEQSWPVAECVSVRNGVVHLPSVIEGRDVQNCLPSPSWFSSVAAGYDFDRNAPKCESWLKFLNSVWCEDRESIDLLQEWCGYLLTSDTSLQKMLLMVGPPRSGKGTISRVITGLVGSSSVSGTSFQALAEAKGLQSLMGKSVAMIEDGRVPGRSDAQSLAANLLTISGEGSVFIGRKYLADMSCRLGVRFVVCSNELPHIPDRGMALASRWSVLHFQKSFLGNEDLNLGDRLMSELPGIFRWAVDGWERLRKNRRFSEPQASMDYTETLRDNSSPVATFVQDYCHLGDGEDYWVSRNDLFSAYLNWANETNYRDPGSRETFGRNLRAAFPKLAAKDRRVEGAKMRGWSGIRLAELSIYGEKIYD